VRLNQGSRSVRTVSTRSVQGALGDSGAPQIAVRPHAHRIPALDALITVVAPFPGILTETMIRGHSFALFEIGRRLERAFGLSATLRAHM
jgi:uncharacterized alpha-E superfamily protein